MGKGCPCIACLCAECQCNVGDPCLLVAAKLCCVDAFVQCGSRCIECSGSPCCDQEHGCCEVTAKVCCIYLEVQFPPGKDIGIGCCGCRCWGLETTGAREAGHAGHGYLKLQAAPSQEAM